MTNPYITIRDLAKTYPVPGEPLHVLCGIDLDLAPGDFVAIVGPAGVGKTTFLNMLTGIDAPTRGQITIGGQNITRTPPAHLIKWRAQHIGIIFQQSQLLPTLTVLENMLFPMDIARVGSFRQRKTCALAHLDRFGVRQHADKTPDMLSGGERQRVAIARALANHPPLIVGDEPTSNLDYMNAEKVFETFHELSQQGTTVIIVSYDREFVKNVPKVFELCEGVFAPLIRQPAVQELAVT